MNDDVQTSSTEEVKESTPKAEETAKTENKKINKLLNRSFFKTNDRKVNSLIKVVNIDLKKANSAAL